MRRRQQRDVAALAVPNQTRVVRVDAGAHPQVVERRLGIAQQVGGGGQAAIAPGLPHAAVVEPQHGNALAGQRHRHFPKQTVFAHPGIAVVLAHVGEQQHGRKGARAVRNAKRTRQLHTAGLGG